MPIRHVSRDVEEMNVTGIWVQERGLDWRHLYGIHQLICKPMNLDASPKGVAEIEKSLPNEF